MTNDELKKKIAEIIESEFENRCRKTNCHNCDLYPDEMCQPNMYADALIEAGFGYVKEAEHRAEVAERALRIVAKEVPCDEWCPFSQKCNVELNGENGYQCCFDEYLRQAEKELAEEGKDE